MHSNLGVDLPRVLNRHPTRQGLTGVYIGRGTLWGNPYTHLRRDTGGAVVVETREEAVFAFRIYFNNRLETDPIFKEQVEMLRGSNLICSCAPLPCHGDVYMEYFERNPYEPTG